VQLVVPLLLLGSRDPFNPAGKLAGFFYALIFSKIFRNFLVGALFWARGWVLDFGFAGAFV
jgi:multisubunit Na+/H+ antiporter MnhE subunit